MDVELVAVGDELLYGDIVNRNAAWLGEQLDAAGLRVRRSVVVPDSVPEIAAAVSEALLGARPRAASREKRPGPIVKPSRGRVEKTRPGA